MKKIIVILGPTASGKTALSMELARKFNGEIVNADSRQIYKSMSIGTDKPAKDLIQKSEAKGPGEYFVQGVRHHLVDIIEPGVDFSLAEYKKIAIEAIEDIIRRGKLPIVVGGTGLYISAIVDNLDIPKVAPSRAMRLEFEKKPLAELVEQLKKLDPETAEQIDLKNPRRVIRALEVAIITGKSFVAQRRKLEPLYEALELGIELSKDELERRVSERVNEQIKRGLLAEVRRLMNKYGKGYWLVPALNTIGYREMGQFLQGSITESEAAEMIKKNTRQYAKRQMTWFKKDKRINWVQNAEEAEKIARKFLIAKF